MKILSSTIRLLQFTGYIAFDCQYSHVLQVAQIALVTFVLVGGVLSMTIFAFKKKYSRIIEFTDSFLMAAATLSFLFVHLAFIQRISKIMESVNVLEEIINSRAIELVQSIYTKANNTAEKITKLFNVSTIFVAIFYCLLWIVTAWITLVSRNQSIKELKLLYEF